MVAVTGATGLLGRHILDRFMSAGIHVVALHRAGHGDTLPEGVIKKEADILDQVSLVEALREVDTLVHAAAFVSFNPRRRSKILEVNVQGTRHIVNTCLELGIKNLIHISSVAAIGKSGSPLTEESVWTEPSSDYSESKYHAELEIYRGAEEGLNVGLLNPSVILATSTVARSSSVLFDYVWRERMFYPGGHLNYVDARDVAEAAFKLYERPLPGEKFILSAGNISYHDFFSKMALLLNKRKPFLKVSPTLAVAAGWLEEMRSFIFNQEPLVTRISARASSQSLVFANQKAADQLGIQFRTLDETLAWCCEDYVRNVKANK